MPVPGDTSLGCFFFKQAFLEFVMKKMPFYVLGIINWSATSGCGGGGGRLMMILQPTLIPPSFFGSSSQSRSIFARRHALIWDNSSIADFLMISLGELALRHRRRPAGQRSRPRRGAQTQFSTHTQTCGWREWLRWALAVSRLMASETFRCLMPADEPCAQQLSAFWGKSLPA